MATDTLFGSFAATTREQWEAVIKKELKGRELSSLYVSVNGKKLPPFHMAR